MRRAKDFIAHNIQKLWMCNIWKKHKSSGWKAAVGGRNIRTCVICGKTLAEHNVTKRQLLGR